MHSTSIVLGVFSLARGFLMTLLAASLCLACGCSGTTKVGGHLVYVNLNSDPPGAETFLVALRVWKQYGGSSIESPSQLPKAVRQEFSSAKTNKRELIEYEDWVYIAVKEGRWGWTRIIQPLKDEIFTASITRLDSIQVRLLSEPSGAKIYWIPLELLPNVGVSDLDSLNGAKLERFRIGEEWGTPWVGDVPYGGAIFVAAWEDKLSYLSIESPSSGETYTLSPEAN